MDPEYLYTQQQLYCIVPFALLSLRSSFEHFVTVFSLSEYINIMNFWQSCMSLCVGQCCMTLKWSASPICFAAWLCQRHTLLSGHLKSLSLTHSLSLSLAHSIFQTVCNKSLPFHVFFFQCAVDTPPIKTWVLCFLWVVNLWCCVTSTVVIKAIQLWPGSLGMLAPGTQPSCTEDTHTSPHRETKRIIHRYDLYWTDQLRCQPTSSINCQSYKIPYGSSSRLMGHLPSPSSLPSQRPQHCGAMLCGKS